MITNWAGITLVGFIILFETWANSAYFKQFKYCQLDHAFVKSVHTR